MYQMFDAELPLFAGVVEHDLHRNATGRHRGTRSAGTIRSCAVRLLLTSLPSNRMVGRVSASTNKRQEILRCAHQLIVKGGYNGFSYADISEVVGIQKASIHHHFPTKANLVCALVSQYRETAQNGIAELERKVADPLGKLRAYLGYWEKCLSDGSDPFCLCAQLASEATNLPQEITLEVRSHFRFLSSWLVSVFERGKKAGSIHLSHSPQVEAELLMALVHGAMLSARAYGDGKIFGVITQPALKAYAKP